MTTTATPPAARVPLDQLRQAGADHITAQLRRALPDDPDKQPTVAAFNSGI